MKYISIVSVQIYFSLLVSILNTSLFKFRWIWVESMQTPHGLQLDDPEIYRFGCIPGGVQLEYVGECKVHFNLGNFNLANEQHELETIFILYILLVNFHVTVIKLVSPAQQYVYLTLFTMQPLTYTVQVISIQHQLVNDTKQSCPCIFAHIS